MQGEDGLGNVYEVGQEVNHAANPTYAPPVHRGLGRIWAAISPIEYYEMHSRQYE
jgi:hypothetical protein